MPKMSRFMRFSRGKIWLVDIGPCKRFDIFHLCDGDGDDGDDDDDDGDDDDELKIDPT